MIRLILIIALLATFFTRLDVAASDFFYVSPNGDNSNNGSQQTPWKTLAHGAKSLKKGQTLIVEEGVYIETEVTRPQANNTTFIAANPLKAIIIYQGLQNVPKFNINGVRNVTVEGFDFSQEAIGNTWGDKLLHCWDGAHRCNIRNNVFHNAMEPLKVWNSNNVTFHGNYIYDAVIGLGTFNASKPIISANTIYYKMDAIQTKGGTRGAIIRDNYVEFVQNGQGNSGITLGGASCGSTNTSNCGNYDPDGYAGYNVRAFNNIIVGNVPHGILIQGCYKCSAYNNLVSGARNGLSVRGGGTPSQGWNWNVISSVPTFRNNIVQHCRDNAVSFSGYDRILQNYNLFHACPNPPEGRRNVYDDPLVTEDWRLAPNSPAIGAGRSFPGVYEIDRDGRQRTAPWDLGPYDT